MNVEIYYLPFTGTDGTRDAPAPERELRLELQMDDNLPSADQISEYWEKQAEFEKEPADDVPTSNAAKSVLKQVWDEWNAGSGRESVVFARRECKDCDAVFTGIQDDGAVDLHARQRDAEAHEEVYGHTVERSTRSLSVGDIVVVDGQGYLCQPIGWGEVEV